MKEVGTVNWEIANVISKQGHLDLLMFVDAVFAIPNEAKVIDISLCENKPSLKVTNQKSLKAVAFDCSEEERITEFE